MIKFDLQLSYILLTDLPLSTQLDIAIVVAWSHVCFYASQSLSQSPCNINSNTQEKLLSLHISKMKLFAGYMQVQVINIHWGGHFEINPILLIKHLLVLYLLICTCNWVKNSETQILNSTIKTISLLCIICNDQPNPSTTKH